MDKELIKAKFNKVICQVLGVDDYDLEGYKSGVSTLVDLGADSLDAVEIIMDLEKEFGISIDNEKVPFDLMKLTYDLAVSYLSIKISANESLKFNGYTAGEMKCIILKKIPQLKHINIMVTSRISFIIDSKVPSITLNDLHKIARILNLDPRAFIVSQGNSGLMIEYD